MKNVKKIADTILTQTPGGLEDREQPDKKIKIKEITKNGAKLSDIINFLKKNPNPDDDQLHDWAESKKYDIHDVERMMYELATNYVKTMEN